MRAATFSPLPPQGAAVLLDLTSLVRIVLPQTPSATERAVAELLIPYWRRITGKCLDIATENTAPDAPAIYLGGTARAAGKPQPGRDGIGIHCDGRDLLLTGGSGRGLINALYTLLCEDLNCRFYTGTVEIIPPAHRAAIVSRTYTPPLHLRSPYYFPTFDGEWSKKNRTNDPEAPVEAVFGGNLSYPGACAHVWHHDTEAFFVHTYHGLVPPERYFASHPEYFQLGADGRRIARQLCETSPEVQQIAAGAALEILRRYPGRQLFSVSKTDGGGTCQCPRCKALNEAEGSDAASMLTLVNSVARAVEREFPEVTITTLAYLETIRPPKTIRPHRNVTIQLCNDLCSWPHPFTPVRRYRPLVEIVEQWQAVGARLSIWDYNVNFSHYAAPMPNLDVIADNIRFWAEHNAVGVMTQGAYQCHGAERDLLRSWVIAQLLWNPDYDEQGLVDDFIDGYFGVAAPEIHAYERLLAAAGRKHRGKIDAGAGIRYPMDHEMFGGDFLPEAFAIYARALAKSAGDPELTARLERDMLPLHYVKLSRAAKAGRVEPAELATFERIARQVGFDFPGETPQPSLDWLLQCWREGNSSSLITVSPAGGSFNRPLDAEITLNSPTLWLTMTTNGGEPDLRSPRVESGSKIRIDQSLKLRISAFMLGSCVGGPIAEYDFVIGE